MRKGVFFNPKMKTLRDISVAFLKAIDAKGLSLLDSTAATGVRGIRYADAGVSALTFLDISKEASAAVKENVRRNGLRRARILNISIGEFAISREKFDIIDLDPFGSPMPYMNDIMKLSKNGSVLMITATDTAVLCGAHPKACIKSYDAKPLHNGLCKEVGIRILIGYAARIAAKFNFGIEMLLSISDMHYMRIFFRLKVGAENAIGSLRQNGFGFYCTACDAFGYNAGIAPAMERRCPACNGRNEIFGPLYLGKLYEKTVLEKLSDMIEEPQKEAQRLMENVNNELDVPFFYYIPKITKNMGIGSVSPEAVMEIIRRKGYACSATQFSDNAIKTAAGMKTVARAVRRINTVSGKSHTLQRWMKANRRKA